MKKEFNRCENVQKSNFFCEKSAVESQKKHYLEHTELQTILIVIR